MTTSRADAVALVHCLNRELNEAISELCLHTEGPEVEVNVVTFDRNVFNRRRPIPIIDVELLEVKKLE